MDNIQLRPVVAVKEVLAKGFNGRNCLPSWISRECAREERSANGNPGSE
jgi:hypothetical protein